MPRAGEVLADLGVTDTVLGALQLRNCFRSRNFRPCFLYASDPAKRKASQIRAVDWAPRSEAVDGRVRRFRFVRAASRLRDRSPHSRASAKWAGKRYYRK